MNKIGVALVLPLFYKRVFYLKSFLSSFLRREERSKEASTHPKAPPYMEGMQPLLLVALTLMYRSLISGRGLVLAPLNLPEGRSPWDSRLCSVAPTGLIDWYTGLTPHGGLRTPSMLFRP